jgi:hypothetical protein
MECWKLLNDFCTAVEKGMLSYTENQARSKDGPSPAMTFPPTFNNQRNTIELALCAHLAIGSEKDIKGRVAE